MSPLTEREMSGFLQLGLRLGGFSSVRTWGQLHRCGFGCVNANGSDPTPGGLKGVKSPRGSGLVRRGCGILGATFGSLGIGSEYGSGAKISGSGKGLPGEVRGRGRVFGLGDVPGPGAGPGRVLLVGFGASPGSPSRGSGIGIVRGITSGVSRPGAGHFTGGYGSNLGGAWGRFVGGLPGARPGAVSCSGSSSGSTVFGLVLGAV